MNLHQLRSFIICSQNRSFARAANELYISVNSLIQQMNSLESELGFQLFVRTKRGIQLTSSGQLFYMGVRDIIGEMDKLITQCLANAGKGTVRIGFPKGGRFLFINSLIEQCGVEYPDIQLSFLSPKESLLNSILNQSTDVVILPLISSIINNAELQYEVLFYTKLYCVYTSSSSFPASDALCADSFEGMDIIVDDKEWSELFPAICDKARSIETIHSSSEVYTECSKGKKYILPEKYARLYAPFQFAPIIDIPDVAGCVVFRRDASPAVKTVAKVLKEVSMDIQNSTSGRGV